jgi:hypothetical protein
LFCFFFFQVTKSKMSEQKYTGSCICDSVKVVVSGAPKRVFVCHCLDCQKSAGGGFQTSVLYDTDNIQIIDPDNKLTKYVIPGATLGSGFDKHKFFCGACGTPVFNQSMKFGGEVTVIKGAFLDKLQDGDGSP